MDMGKYMDGESDSEKRIQECIQKIQNQCEERRRSFIDFCKLIKGKKILLSFFGGELLVFLDVKCVSFNKMFEFEPIVCGDVFVVEGDSENNYVEIRELSEYKMPILGNFNEHEEYKILNDKEWDLFLDEYKRLSDLSKKSKNIFEELRIKMALK